MKYPAYPKYKPSGIEWLGEIPEHWDVKRTDAVLPTRRDAADFGSSSVSEVFYYSIPAIEETGNGIVEETGNIESNKVLLQGGELLVSRLNPRKARVLVSEKHSIPTICSSEFVVMKPRGCDISFAKYSYLSEEVRQYLSARVESATRSHQRVNPDAISKLWWSFPPTLEQRAIASFLDRETTRIDALIAKKERQIELLHEKRTALISAVVTGKLRVKQQPDGSFCLIPLRSEESKDSGVEWLGNVPKEWGVKKLKRVAKRVDVGIAEAATHAYSDMGVPLIRSTNVRENQILTEDLLSIADWFAKKNSSKFLFAGDIVTVRTGNAGVSAIVPQALDRSQCFTLLMTTLATNQCPEFYCYYLNSTVGQVTFALEGWGTAQTNISVPILQNVFVPEPLYGEQLMIASYLRSREAEAKQLICRISDGVARVMEYRSALISAAVTGKIDVRNCFGE